MFRKLASVGLATIAALAVDNAMAQNASGSLAIAAGPQGSANYALSAGIATIVGRHTLYKVTVVPHSGTTTQLPKVGRGEIMLGVNDGGSVQHGYLGKVQFSEAFKGLRLLSIGSMNQITFAVLADSEIKSLADIKGKRVTARWAALPICQIHSTALLANAGLSWSDVREVPVTQIVQAVQALKEQRVDVLSCAAVGIPALREMHAQTPIRFISIDPSQEAMARARAYYAYNERPDRLRKGAYGYVPNDAYFLAYPWYLYGHEKLAPEAAHAIVKAISVHNDELAKIHPIFRGWKPKGMATTDAGVPFHTGAMRYYKETGLWNDAMDAVQKRLLAQ